MPYGQFLGTGVQTVNTDDSFTYRDFAVVVTILGVCAFIALTFYANPAPWSPLGHSRQPHEQQLYQPTIPPGYQPATPTPSHDPSGAGVRGT